MRVVQILEEKPEENIHMQVFIGGFVSDEGKAIGTTGRIVKILDTKKNKSTPERFLYYANDSDVVLFFEGIINLK